MEDIKVTFTHPTTNATLEAEISPDMTVNEAISALVSEGFIEPPTQDDTYVLGVNGGQKIEGEQTLASAGVRDGSTITVVSFGQYGSHK